MIHALILGAATAAASPATIKPVRTTVYSFSYSTPDGKHTGTIHADVLGMTQDGGLAVRFSQDVPGVTAETFAPAVCAVYGDTRVQCQKPGSLSAYETELGHLLGRGFVDGNSMDEKNHWRVAGDLAGGKLTDDFTVTSNTSGILNIQETRDYVLGGSDTHHLATITYDLNKTIPTKVHYAETGASKNDASVTADYALQSDWIVPAPSPSPKQ